MDTIVSDMAPANVPSAITLHSDLDHIVVLCPYCRSTHKHDTIRKAEQEVVSLCQKGHYILVKEALDGKSIDFALRRRDMTNKYKRKMRSEAKKAKSEGSVGSGSE